MENSTAYYAKKVKVHWIHYKKGALRGKASPPKIHRKSSTRLTDVIWKTMKNCLLCMGAKQKIEYCCIKKLWSQLLSLKKQVNQE